MDTLPYQWWHYWKISLLVPSPKQPSAFVDPPREAGPHEPLPFHDRIVCVCVCNLVQRSMPVLSSRVQRSSPAKTRTSIAFYLLLWLLHSFFWSSVKLPEPQMRAHFGLSIQQSLLNLWAAVSAVTAVYGKETLTEAHGSTDKCMVSTSQQQQ